MNGRESEGFFFVKFRLTCSTVLIRRGVFVCVCVFFMYYICIKGWYCGCKVATWKMVGWLYLTNKNIDFAVVEERRQKKTGGKKSLWINSTEQEAAESRLLIKMIFSLFCLLFKYVRKHVKCWQFIDIDKRISYK